ncbi:MAG: UDP-N-acetylmuramate dehydrogenase [Agarilytica sp.]
MHIESNKPLIEFNTLALASTAKFFVPVDSLQELKDSVAWAASQKLNVLVLGGGSNVILPSCIDALVIHPNIKGITSECANEGVLLVTVGAGEQWHYFVSYCVENGFYGLENLALIPGNCGAAPVQNIGAYGVEVKDLIHSVSAFDIETQAVRTFSNEQCKFAYRESIFKNQEKGRYIILDIVFRLSKTSQLNVSYPALAAELGDISSSATPKQVMNAVIGIRSRKLPDPSRIPNAGSFFKNPVITLASYARIKQDYPEIPAYDADAAHKKVAAAWLIESAGWKGRAMGDVAIHPDHALVLTNLGQADADDIFSVAQNIQADVLSKFDILLEMEPQLFC